MLRTNAIALLHEITTVCPDILESSSHISLQLSEGDTRLIIKSSLDFEEKTVLEKIVRDKGYAIVDCSSGVWVIY